MSAHALRLILCAAVAAHKHACRTSHLTENRLCKHLPRLWSALMSCCLPVFEGACVSACESLRGDPSLLAVFAVVIKGYRLFRSNNDSAKRFGAKLWGCQATRATPAAANGHLWSFYLLAQLDTVALYFFLLKLQFSLSLELFFCLCTFCFFTF